MSSHPVSGPELSPPERRRLSPPDLSTGRKLIRPPPGKESPSLKQGASGQQFVYSGVIKPILSNSPSSHFHFPKGEGQVSL